jgi:DNA-binding LacI/PurR family transcriptional regulator
MKDQFYPTEAQILAGMIKRTASTGLSAASIQRSHRFPSHIFFQIENIAQMADVSVSAIINQLLAVGLEDVKKQLSDEEVQKIILISKEQSDRPTKMLTESNMPKKNKK